MFDTLVTKTGEIAGDLTSDVLPAFVGLSVASLGITLAVSWIKRIRSAV